MTGFEGNSALEALRTATEDISSIAEQFYKLYYESVDHKRHLVNRLYLDTAVLVWNGNAHQNLPEIQKFYEQLPTTVHNIQVVDSQLMSSSAVGAQKTLLIQTAGKVRIEDGGKSYKPFQQVFIVTAQGDKWKIVSDCYRLQLPTDSLKGASPEEQLQKLQLGLDMTLSAGSSGVQTFQQQQQQQIQQQQLQQQQQLLQQQQMHQQQLHLQQQQQLQLQQQQASIVPLQYGSGL